MIQGTFRLSAIALCATALASLIPLSSAGAAPAEMRHHGAAIHRTAPSTAMRAGHAAHAMTFRGGHRFASRAHFAGRRYGYDHRRYGYGYHRHYRRGYGVVGGVIGGGYAYPYYTGGYYAYGYRRHHGCWWYYRYDPADTPSWCAAYSYEYPSYGYDYAYAYPSYGFAFGFGERFRRHHHHFAFGDHRFGHHFAFHGATSPVEGRAASVSGGAMRHNFGTAHFGGGAHMMGGTHFMGGGAGASAHVGGAGAHVGGGHYIH